MFCETTRGGLATTLNEIAKQSNVGIALIEKEIPVKQAVASVCEILGFDPLYIANEGKLIAIVSKEDSENVLEAMHSSKYGIDAVIIGEVVAYFLAQLGEWNFVLSPTIILASLGFSMFVGVVFGVWPARTASKLKPVEALRFE